mmetsp:Transcript_876/g.3202  ORF Transcript_876/g.3202 Transcript_876/m.3202 type:complete len:270 (+) Transcript_876:280-1089(+)
MRRWYKSASCVCSWPRPAASILSNWWSTSKLRRSMAARRLRHGTDGSSTRRTSAALSPCSCAPSRTACSWCALAAAATLRKTSRSASESRSWKSSSCDTPCAFVTAAGRYTRRYMLWCLVPSSSRTMPCALPRWEAAWSAAASLTPPACSVRYSSEDMVRSAYASTSASVAGCARTRRSSSRASIMRCSHRFAVRLLFGPYTAASSRATGWSTALPLKMSSTASRHHCRRITASDSCRVTSATWAVSTLKARVAMATGRSSRGRYSEHK